MPLISLAVVLMVVGAVAWLINSYFPMEESIRAIINLMLGLILAAIALWFINTYVPMPRGIKAILTLVVVAVAGVRILQAAGLWNGVVRMWSNLTGH
jgi:hypothetical protein